MLGSTGLQWGLCSCFLGGVWIGMASSMHWYGLHVIIGFHVRCTNHQRAHHCLSLLELGQTLAALTLFLPWLNNGTQISDCVSWTLEVV